MEYYKKHELEAGAAIRAGAYLSLFRKGGKNVQ